MLNWVALPECIEGTVVGRESPWSWKNPVVNEPEQTETPESHSLVRFVKLSWE